MARFQEIGPEKGKVVLDDRTVIMVDRKASLILGIPYWAGGGCSAPNGKELAKALQRQANRKGKR